MSFLPLLIVIILLLSPSSALAFPAAYDTLSVEHVLQRRQAHLDSLLLPESAQLDTAGVASTADSLDRGGAELGAGGW